jgi:hypothetical protein
MEPQKPTTGERCRIRKRELFRSLGYDPHPGQAEVHRSKALRRVLACGARWGKSTCASMEAIAALLEPSERSIGWIVGPSYDLAERIFRPVESLIAQHFEHRVVVSKPRERLLIVRNLGGGISELRGKSADNPCSLLGEGLDWLIVDEAARLREDTWANYLSQRLLDKQGWALILSTPKGCNWFYKLHKLGKRDEHYASWSQPSAANPLLDGEVIEAERKRLTEDVFAQEYLAEFLGRDPDPCEVCGGPSPDARSVHIWRGEGDVPTCRECGEYVDSTGRTLVHLGPDGKPMCHIIELVPGSGSWPETLQISEPFSHMVAT